MQGKGVCVCRDYGGVIGCVAVSFVRAVTEHKAFGVPKMGLKWGGVENYFFCGIC
jgi:hypothetical protein